MIDVDTFITIVYVMSDDFCQSRQPPEAEEMRRWRRENEMLRQERDILKKDKGSSQNRLTT